MPEVAINYRMVQNKWTPGSSLFKFVVRQRFEMSQNDARKSRNANAMIMSSVTLE